jgi:hypothetical protein
LASAGFDNCNIDYYYQEICIRLDVENASCFLTQFPASDPDPSCIAEVTVEDPYCPYYNCEVINIKTKDQDQEGSKTIYNI